MLLEQVGDSLSVPFFPPLEITPQDAIENTHDFASDAPAQAILAFWEEQLEKMGDLIQQASSHYREWGKLIPPELTLVQTSSD